MIMEVSKILQVSPEAILSRRRDRLVSLVRSIYFWVLHENGYTAIEIGRLCDRGHSNVSQMIKGINDAIEVGDKQVVELIDKVRHIKHMRVIR